MWPFLTRALADVKATREELIAARIPINYRDNCVDGLVELNKCRFEAFYLPWKCTHERHNYEVCQYKEYLERLKHK